jgi:4-hydroxy-2-oxoheptanedioate aldolase
MTIPWPRIVEVIGSTGIFDYIEFTAVNSNWDLELLENFSRAVELFPNMASTIKVGDTEREMLASRAIDAGFQNLKFEGIGCARDVRECLRYVRPETPELGGSHRWGSRRLSGFDGGPVEWMKAMSQIGFFIVIEKKEAVDNIEEILSVEGIDMVSFGRKDYAISVGKAGQQDTPEIRKVERGVAELCLKKGIAFRVHLHGSFEAAKPWLEMGVHHFFICADYQSIREECQREGGGLRKLLESM